jgi:hypothetical protein
MFSMRLGIIICLLTITPVHYAISQETHQEALDLIYKFADKMCIAMPKEGGGSNFVLSGESNARLNKLLGGLVGLGVAGAGYFQKNQYKGVLQKDLISALKTTTNCRLEIFIKLQDRLIPTASNSNPNNSSNGKNSSPSFQYPVKIQARETGEAISDARVFIEVLGDAPIDVLTDSNGFARVFINESHAGDPGRLTVQANGYQEYSQNVDLNPESLSHVVQLEPKAPNTDQTSDENQSSPFFQYSLEVEVKETGEAISNARVVIEVSSNAPIDVLTDSNGFARVFIDENRAGEPGRLIVQADGYEKYVQYIDLNPKALPKTVQLEPQGEHKNRIGLATGYTRFKNMEETAYTMAGVVYARRLILFNLSELTCYGYLDLTIMTSLNSEETVASGISDTETTFGRATSFCINYVQSNLLGKGFSLLIQTGFQWLDIDLEINDSKDKLTKKSMLLGGGVEYNYKRLFVQANLNALIGEDKNLGHDIDAAIKTGINF